MTFLHGSREDFLSSRILFTIIFSRRHCFLCFGEFVYLRNSGHSLTVAFLNASKALCSLSKLRYLLYNKVVRTADCLSSRHQNSHFIRFIQTLHWNKECNPGFRHVIDSEKIFYKHFVWRAQTQVVDTLLTPLRSLRATQQSKGTWARAENFWDLSNPCFILVLLFSFSFQFFIFLALNVVFPQKEDASVVDACVLGIS